MTAKEYLSQARNLELKVRQLRQQAEEIKRLAQSVSSPSMSEKVQSSQTGGALEKSVERYLALAERAEFGALAFQELRLEIISRIGKLDRFEYIEVLTYRYIDYLRFEEIACKMNYSFRQVRRFHQRALESFEEKNKDIL